MGPPKEHNTAFAKQSGGIAGGDAEPGTVANTVTRTQDPYTQIIALARSASTKHRFLADALRCIARAYASPYAALHVRFSSQVFQDDCHFGASDPAFWKPGVQQFLTESLAEPKLRAKLMRARTGPAKVAFLSAPIFDPTGPAIGAVALAVPVRGDSDAAGRLSLLESLMLLVSFSAEFVGSGTKTIPGATPRVAKLGSAKASSAEELAFTITNELRNKIGAEQTALGLVRGPHVRVLAISGLDEVHRAGQGAAALGAAMEECLDAGMMIGCQRDDTFLHESGAGGYRLHKQWHAAAKGDAVVSLPLRGADDCVAILSLRRSAAKPFAKDELERIQAQVEPLAASLLLAHRAGRGLVRHGVESLRESLTALFSPGAWGRKAALTALIVGLVWFGFGTLEHRVSIPCTVAAAQTRHLAAPFDAALVLAAAVEGDRVQAGDVLCRFDTLDLEQQRAELAAQLAVFEHEADRARAAQNAYEATLAVANQTLVAARLAILDRRIEQATVRAPIDGLVIVGDLRPRVGEVLTRGTPLFQVAPMDGWKLELEVPERVADDFRADLTGMFALMAQPSQGQGCRITRVSPSSVTRNRLNVYLAEAEFLKSVDSELGVGAAEVPSGPRFPLRPGMQGYAKVDLGRRPVWWLTLHRAVDYLRLHFWL